MFTPTIMLGPIARVEIGAEFAKGRFFAREQGRLVRRPTTHEQRLSRRIRGRFTRHEIAHPR